MAWQDVFPLTLSRIDAEQERELRLVAQARAGADWALAALVARYQPPVTRYLTRLTGDADLARQQAEKIFFRMDRRIRGPHGGQHLRLWLLRSCTEAGLDAMRQPRRHAPRLLTGATGPVGLLSGVVNEPTARRLQTGLSAMTKMTTKTTRQVRKLIWTATSAMNGQGASASKRTTTASGAETEAVSAQTPEEESPQEALRFQLIRAVLAEMPYGDAQCLALHLVAGLNQAEVALALGITGSATRRRIVHGLQLFSQRYEAAAASLGLPPDVLMPPVPRAEMVAQPEALSGTVTVTPADSHDDAATHEAIAATWRQTLPPAAASAEDIAASSAPALDSFVDAVELDAVGALSENAHVVEPHFQDAGDAPFDGQVVESVSEVEPAALMDDHSVSDMAPVVDALPAQQELAADYDTATDNVAEVAVSQEDQLPLLDTAPEDEHPVDDTAIIWTEPESLPMDAAPSAMHAVDAISIMEWLEPDESLESLESLELAESIEQPEAPAEVAIAVNSAEVVDALDDDALDGGEPAEAVLIESAPVHDVEPAGVAAEEPPHVLAPDTRKVDEYHVDGEDEAAADVMAEMADATETVDIASIADAGSSTDVALVDACQDNSDDERHVAAVGDSPIEADAELLPVTTVADMPVALAGMVPEAEAAEAAEALDAETVPEAETEAVTAVASAYALGAAASGSATDGLSETIAEPVHDSIHEVEPVAELVQVPRVDDENRHEVRVVPVLTPALLTSSSDETPVPSRADAPDVAVLPTPMCESQLVARLVPVLTAEASDTTEAAPVSESTLAALAGDGPTAEQAQDEVAVASLVSDHGATQDTVVVVTFAPEDEPPNT